MTMIGWSPSQEEALITTKQRLGGEVSFINNEALSDFLARSLDTPERQVALGYLFTGNKQLKEILEYANNNEVVAILDELDALAVEGQQERATLQRMEVETTNIRATEAGLENELRKANMALANIRASRPGQFSTRADLARWDARLSAAEVAAKEAEDAVRAYGYALPSHLQNLEAQKIRVGQLQGKDKSLRSRLAFLRGEPAPDAASGFSNTATGLR